MLFRLLCSLYLGTKKKLNMDCFAFMYGNDTFVSTLEITEKKFSFRPWYKRYVFNRCGVFSLNFEYFTLLNFPS